MSQSGRLLNPPINTPAPGTGALHPKVSPNGALVAYWFETLVNSPLCVFCVSLSNQALLTYSDRFTHHEAIGTPNTGGWPSWSGNDTIVLGNGSAELKYYRLGMPAAADWFNESVFIGGGAGLQTLLDAEVAPTGDRLAVVRGNHQETIRILELSGPPPVAPTPLPCLYQNPSGRFVEPTWTSDGRLLAWQEDDGVWLGDPRDPRCPDPRLVIPGAREPDLSPAAINPGPRPPCEHPGNPISCAGPDPRQCNPCPRPDPKVDTATIRRALGGLAKDVTRSLARLRIRGLLRTRRVTIEFTAPAAGTLAATLTSPAASARRATVLAGGRRAYRAAGKAKLTIKLTKKGRKRLRSARRLKVAVKVSFTPTGAKAISTTTRIQIRR